MCSGENENFWQHSLVVLFSPDKNLDVFVFVMVNMKIPMIQ